MSRALARPARPARRAALATLVAVGAILTVPGCLAYMPSDRDPRHLAIRWRPDLEAARTEAAATGRPALVVLVSGDIEGSC